MFIKHGMKTKSLLLLSLLSIWLSCTKTLDLQLGKFPSKIVLNSFFQPDSTFKVLVSYPIEITQRGRPVIEDAQVRLYKDDIFIEELQYNNYFYRSMITPQVGSCYRIEVEAKNYPSVTAVDTVPDQPILLTTHFIKDYLYEYNNGLQDKISRLDLTLFDDLSRRNYYEIFLMYMYKTDYSQAYSLRNVGFKKNECSIVNNEALIDYNPRSIVFSNELFTSEEQKINLDVYSNIFDSNAVDIHLIIMFRKVSHSYYAYQKSMTIHNYFQYGDDDLWATPMPVDLYTNVENGLGVFATYNEVRDTISVN